MGVGPEKVMNAAVVVGTGGIGSVLGAALEARGVKPLYVGRQGPVAHTATVHGIDDGPAERRLVCVKAPSAAELARAPLAFFAVKAMDLGAALAWTKHLSAGTTIVSLANGAVWDELARAAAAKREFVWRLGFATFGATALGAHEYAFRAKRGEIVFGPVAGEGAMTAAEKELVSLPRRGPGFAWHDRVERLALQKWLFNVVINTLAAARRLPKNGDLLADIPSVAAAFDEAYALAQELFAARLGAKDEVYKRLVELIESTEANENSMARDRRLGRPIEHAFLGGVVNNAKDPSLYPLLRDLDRELAAKPD